MTQYQKIITTMTRDPQRWWLPKDFMQSHLGDLFVGYEASARLSELASMYPDFIDTEKQGRFKARRINVEAFKKRVEEGTVDADLIPQTP